MPNTNTATDTFLPALDLEERLARRPLAMRDEALEADLDDDLEILAGVRR